MTCNKVIPGNKKKGIPPSKCDGIIQCVDSYTTLERGYCYCGEHCCGGHDLPKLELVYKCSKCNSKTGPINDAYELVNVINHYLEDLP